MERCGDPVGERRGGADPRECWLIGSIFASGVSAGCREFRQKDTVVPAARRVSRSTPEFAQHAGVRAARWAALRARYFVLLVALGGLGCVLPPAGLRREPPTPGQRKGHFNCPTPHPGWLGFARACLPRMPSSRDKPSRSSAGPPALVCRAAAARFSRVGGRFSLLGAGSVGGPVFEGCVGWAGAGQRRGGVQACVALFAGGCVGGGPADDLLPCGRVDGIRGSQAVTCVGACA